MPVKYWPDIVACCMCIPNLRAASAIIAVLSITTSPILSWLLVQHSYTLRVSCILSAASRMDVVDVNVSNVVSFGFGVNADMGLSCLAGSDYDSGPVNKVIKGVGWILLMADFVFLIISVVFLMRLYRNPTVKLNKAFIISGLLATLLSTLYGIMYVIVCAVRGKGMGLCQLFLSLFDLLLWSYFFVVINAFSKKLGSPDA